MRRNVGGIKRATVFSLGALSTVVAVAVGPIASGAEPVTVEDFRHQIRPGAPILPVGFVDVHGVHDGQIDKHAFPCTANFVFRDNQGNRYIGTAGHCAPIPRGKDVVVWRYPKGPIADNLQKKPFGRFVYAGNRYSKSALPGDVPGIDRFPIVDFALIRVYPGVRANPQMAHFGGPTGINSEISPLPVVLHQYGWGTVGSTLVDLPGAKGAAVEIPAHGRTFVAPGMPNPNLVRMYGAAAGGDSGSPVISADGRAVGVLVAANYTNHHVSADGVDSGTDAVVRLRRQVTLAERRLGIQLTLLKAPLL